MGLCLSKEEQVEINGAIYNPGVQSFTRDTVPSDCERCARNTFPDGTADEWKCVRI
jgi:hypothetical protein